MRDDEFRKMADGAWDEKTEALPSWISEGFRAYGDCRVTFRLTSREGHRPRVYAQTLTFEYRKDRFWRKHEDGTRAELAGKPGLESEMQKFIDAFTAAGQTP
jgi:hypothetical protein